MAQKSADHTHNTVLFVDDDLFVLHAYQRMTRQLTSCRCLFMTDRQFIGQPDILQQVQLVLADLHMPAISGEQLLRQCRRVQPAARRVLLSGDLTSAAESLQGTDLHLTKPLKRETLLQLLTEALPAQQSQNR